MITIQELIIKWVKPLQHWWLSLNFHIKKEDISKEDREKLEELWSSWDSLVCVLQEITEEKIEEAKIENDENNLISIDAMIEEAIDESKIDILDIQAQLDS